MLILGLRRNIKHKHLMIYVFFLHPNLSLFDLPYLMYSLFLVKFFVSYLDITPCLILKSDAMQIMFVFFQEFGGEEPSAAGIISLLETRLGDPSFVDTEELLASGVNLGIAECDKMAEATGRRKEKVRSLIRKTILHLLCQMKNIITIKI